MMKLPALVLILLFYGTIHAQTPVSTVDHKHKNNIYGGATAWPIMGSISINYERLILDFPERPGLTFYARISFGKWTAWGAGGYGGILTGNVIFLRKSNHIEAGLGKLLTYDIERRNREPNTEPEKYTFIYSTINLGYRYQNPASHLFFRAGLSYPEGLYAGLGISF
jgi:hypothetical protein